MINKLNLPSKVLTGQMLNSTGKDLWPYNDGDDFWEGGSSPRKYTWTATFDIAEQSHSSPNTRRPYWYDGIDINQNMWVADLLTGMALKITSVSSKTSTTITCVVEDYLRYNTLRYAGGVGKGIFADLSSVVFFELNEDNMPLIDSIPTTISTVFYPNLMSRFASTTTNYYFEIDQENHDFEIGDLVSADPSTHSFKKTDADYPHLIGRVAYTSNGSNVFMVDPFQQINDDMDDLIGDVADIIYSNATTSGQLSLVGNLPVMIKLRNSTASFTVGTGSSTDAGASVKLNGVETAVGDGTAGNFVSNINANTSVHGVSASSIASPTIVSSNNTQVGYGEPAMYITAGHHPVASINGYQVTFTTTTVGQSSYGDTYSLEEDMAQDINAANIPYITASAQNNMLYITNYAGGAIDIVNITPDASGYNFAGPNSGSGLALSTPANTGGGMIRLDAIDARAINIYDLVGSATQDFGLTSSENGIKAAGVVVEQGLRSSSSYVVSNIAGRDALNAIFGDICFVTDKGNGEWAYYAYTLTSEWIKFADKDSAATDAQTIEIEIDHTSDTTGLIYTISDNSSVTAVTIKVLEAFDAPAVLSVGDDSDNSILMDQSLNDLTSVSEYSYNPSVVYTTGNDTNINYYLSVNGATTGRAKIVIVYS